MVLVAYRTLEAQPATGEHQCPKFIFLRGVQIGDGTFIAGEIKISLINLHLKLVGFWSISYSCQNMYVAI